MQRGFWGTAPVIASCSLLFVSSVGLPFQSAPDTKVTLTPRARTVPLNVPAGAAHLRVDASLAVIPVHVTTDAGNPVMMLDKANFRIYEEGVQQTITYFAQDDAALSVGLVFDSSGSMKDKKKKAAEAAAAFFQTATQQDEFFLVEFDERPNFRVPFTPDSKMLYDRILRTKPFGRTSLLDAIDMALTHMKDAHNSRKAIVILSDGDDNRSSHTFLQIKNHLLETDVQLYAMGIFDPDDPNKAAPDDLNGPRLLDDLSRESGGTHFRVGRLADLPEIAQRLGRELRSQYLLGYSPSNEIRDGKYRRVKVDLLEQNAPFNLRYRRGYYAPTQ